jgi:hypothetical protein
MNAVQRFCSEAILIDSGKIIQKGKPEIVADEYRDINMMHSSEKGAPRVNARNETVKIEMLDQTKDKLVFKMIHHEKDSSDYYFGFSVIKDGVTFAELNNFGPDKPTIKKKQLTYELDIKNFNSGVYEISAVLFNVKGRDPVAFIKNRPQFIIKGSDTTRGGAIKLTDSWRS